MKPSLTKRYEYFGKVVKIVRINPYPSTDLKKKTTIKYEVTVEGSFGERATVPFEEVSELK